MKTPPCPSAAGLFAILTLLLGATPVRAAFPDLRLVPVSSGAMVAPVDIAHAGDGSGRLFIADQLGTIRILDTATGTLLATPFLDLSSKLVTISPTYDERGLLGLAFHPSYETNGKFYVYYSAPSPNVTESNDPNPVNHMSVVAEYTVSVGDSNVADAGSERILFTLDQPQSNHNGGDLAFGPDGKLYISLGDGGSSNDNNAGHTGGSASRPTNALGNAQDKTNLFGKLLRIDPLGNNGPGGQYGIPADNPFVLEGGGVRKEIFAYGLRNPWRISFDPTTGRLYVADVGQGRVEEIDLVTSGGNYGWRNREGTFSPTFSIDAPGTGPFVDPIAQYAHPGETLGDPALPQIGLSVTGGEVYRGGDIPSLYGKYVFADWSNDRNVPGGTVLGLEETSPETFALSQLNITGGNPIGRFITALGTDERGEIYVATRTISGPAPDGNSQATGAIFLIAAATVQATLTLPADRDNTIFSETLRINNSNGSGVYTFSGHLKNQAPGERRTLMRFDLSTIPVGAIIQSATITMRLSRDATAAATLRWHRLTSDWGEGASDAGDPGGTGIGAATNDATWINRFHPGTAWSTQGGDYVTSASASATVGGLGFKTWTSAQLAQDVQDWVSGTNSNFGWILIDLNDVDSAKRFDSRESTTAANRPKLDVTYSGPVVPSPILLGLANGSDSGTSATDGITNDTTPTIQGIAPLGSTVRILVNGSDVIDQVVSSVPFSITTPGLDAGTRTITATASQGGLTSSASSPLVLTIDTAAPVAAVPDLVAATDSGAANSDNVTNDNTPNFSSAGAAGVTVQFSSNLVGAIGSAEAGTPVTVSTLADGIHQITAIATDLAGNTGTASSALPVTIDTASPAAPTGLDLLDSSDTGSSNTDNDTFDITLEISGDAESGSTVNLTSSRDGSVGTATGASPWTITTPMLSPGLHQFTATATDLAGNTSASSTALAVTVRNARDAKPIAVPLAVPGIPSADAVSWLENSSNATGTYDGLLRDQADASIVLGAASRFVVASTGAFSGTVQFKGRSFTVRGTIPANGTLLANVPVSRSTPISLDLQLRKTQVGGFVLRGTIAWGGATANAEIPRSPYSKSHLLDTFPGLYTMLIPSEADWTDAQPSGDGWARVSISTLGAVSVTGVWGDGLSFTESAYVSGDLEIHLFSEPYRTALDGKRGRIGGRLVLGEVPDVSDFAGRLYWEKVADLREARYPSGFILQPWAIGSKFVPPLVGQPILADLANQEYNAELSLIGPTAPSTVEESLDRVLTWKPTNALVHYGPQSLSGAVSSKNGGVSGKFYDPVTRVKVGFAGVAFQKQNIAAGTFVNGNASGAVRILPGTNFVYPGSESAGTLDRVQPPANLAAAPGELNTAFGVGAVGRFDGVLTQTGTISGALENLVLTAGRLMTGTLWIDGKRYSFRQTLGTGGDATFDIVRTSLTPISVDIDLTLTGVDGFGFTGTVTIDSVAHTLDAQRLPVFTRTIRAPQEGSYTVAMRAPDVVNPVVPGGDGYGTMAVSYLGNCSGSITLADGTGVTLAGHVARIYDDAGKETSEWSFHRGLYGRTPKGYLAGKLTFRSIANVSDVDGEWHWVKQVGAQPVGAYATIDVTRRVVGSLYARPLVGPVIDGLTNESFNVWLRFGGPNLGNLSTLDRPATWTSANQLIYFGPERVTLSLNPRNGLVTGTYVDTTTGVNLRYGGVLLQTQDLVTGSYRGPAPGSSGLFSVEPRVNP